MSGLPNEMFDELHILQNVNLTVIQNRAKSHSSLYPDDEHVACEFLRTCKYCVTVSCVYPCQLHELVRSSWHCLIHSLSFDTLFIVS